MHFCVVAVNRFPTDTDNEIDFIIAKCKELGVNTVLSNVWADGGKGGVELAKEVVRLCEEEDNSNFTFSYETESSIEEKIDLHEAIKNLRPEYQSVIHLKYFDDLSIEEIATQLEMSSNTVKSHLRRGKRELRLMLKEGSC